MRKRTLIPLLIAVILLCVLGAMFYLRAKAPPEAARLLPESDAIVYLNLKSIRSLTHFDASPIARSPDFQHFIDATGIVPERDLDTVALALHRMPDPRGPNGPVAYSEVFIGRFDGVRLARYLASIASATETYTGRTIYTIPIEAGVPENQTQPRIPNRTQPRPQAVRTLRIAQLGYDVIAASNMPTPEQIHSMLDRFRAGALSTPGSSLLAARYRQVPLLSEAWGIGHIGLPFSDNGLISVLGLQLPLPEDTDFVASLRYTAAARVLSGSSVSLRDAVGLRGAVHLRIEEIAPNPAAARSTVETLTTLLNILRGIASEQAAAQQEPAQQAPTQQAAAQKETTQQAPKPQAATSQALAPQAESPTASSPSSTAMRTLLASITLTDHDSRAILNATASLDQLKALTTAHNPVAVSISSETPTTSPASK